MTDQRTEVRAIARYTVKGWNDEQIEIPDDSGRWVSFEDHATALAAKDAELAALQTSWRKLDDTANEWADRAHQAEAQLAEANKALEPFAQRCDEAVRPDDSDNDGVTVKAKFLRAARRAREQGGENNG